MKHENLDSGQDLDEVAKRAANGDTGAFAQLVRATHGRYFRLASRITLDAGEAEDVLQDAYVRGWNALRAGQFDRDAKVETWLYRIVANAAIDAVRARKRRVRTQDALPTSAAVDGDRSTAAHVALRELQDWLADLPEEQRTALVLKELEGRSSAEIAELLGTTEGAVEQRLVRARAMLRRRTDG